MNELQKLYDVLVREGKYTKSFEEFQNQWNDEAYKDKVYDVVSRDGLYTKDRNSFKQKYSGRVQQDVNEDGSVVEQAFGLVNKIAKTPAAPQKTHELPRMPKPGELQNIGREDENAAFDSQGNYNPINALPESIKVTAKQIHAENEAKKKPLYNQTYLQSRRLWNLLRNSKKTLLYWHHNPQEKLRFSLLY